LDRDVLKHIFSFLEIYHNGWYNVMRTCKRWNEIGRQVFDPIQWGAINHCIHHNNVLCLRMLINQKKLNQMDYQGTLRKCTALGCVELVKELLKVTDYDIHESILLIACENANVEVIKVLLQDKRVDPTARANRAIEAACENGHLDVLKVLLTDKRADPSSSKQHPIRIASYYGYADIVRELLQDERVDPTVENNYPLTIA
jgi:ankyrin repeat protein